MPSSTSTDRLPVEELTHDLVIVVEVRHSTKCVVMASAVLRERWVPVTTTIGDRCQQVYVEWLRKYPGHVVMVSGEPAF